MSGDAKGAAEAALTAPLDEAGQRRMRAYRLGRVQSALREWGIAAAVLFDPCNIRYATGTRNMAVWTLHNHVRAAFVPAEGPTVLFEFGAGKWPVDAERIETVGEVRAISGLTHFYAGSRKGERTRAWASEIAQLMSDRCGGERRIAFDHLDPPGLAAIEDQQLTVLDGEGLLERARLIKSAEEIACIRHAIAVAELGMERMREALVPGMTENQLWSILHQTNIAHGGEWIETRLLSSGPRTNPWMQECGERVIEDGDLVAFDTDMIGPNGYCADISRTFICGEPRAREADEMRHLYQTSRAQIEANCALFRPGLMLAEVVASDWPIPEAFVPYRYGLAHGVGLKDEYPFLPNKMDAALLGDPEEVLRPGMVFSVESYIGAVGGPFGVKLEEQILVTENGCERLSRFPFEAALGG